MWRRRRTAPATTGSRLRHPSDLTDRGMVVGRAADSSRPTRGGRKREVAVREVVNGVMYVLSTGCQWRIHPQGSAATEHATRLPDPVELRWDDREDPLCAVCAMPRGNRSGGQPDSLRD